MKRKNNKTSMLFLTALFYLLAGVGFTACEDNTVTGEGGKLPGTEGMDNTFGMLQSVYSTESTIQMKLRRNKFSDKLSFKLTQPASENTNLEIFVDESLVEEFNKEHETTLPLFPKEYITLANAGKLSIASGKQESDQISITFAPREVEPGEYLIPISVKQLSGNSKPASGYQSLYYTITVRSDQRNIEEKLKGETIIAYVNTEEMSPLVANQFTLQVRTRKRPPEVIYLDSWIDIVNLRMVNIKYNASEKKPVIELNSDILYVLNHAEKYIAPMQDNGLKVCLTVQGGGQGIGFCNITDQEIESIVFQLKELVSRFELDGINLYDEGSGYGKEGMPAVNQTSYPKLIKKLRESLPEGKLIILTDIGEPTVTFNEVQDGIEVGNYIDYALSGDIDKVVDPWGDGSERKPIAGLSQDKYGAITLGYIERNLSQEVANQISNFLNTSSTNKVFAFYDIPALRLGKEEGANGKFSEITMPLYTGYMVNVIQSEEYETGDGTGYNGFVKDW